MFHVPQYNRLKNHQVLGSDDSYGNNGFFIIPHNKILFYFYNVHASDGEGWEHCSITISSSKRKVERCPTWEEMCFIKNLFWDESDCVIEFHPPKSEYVSMHPYCLHFMEANKSNYTHAGFNFSWNKTNSVTNQAIINEITLLRSYAIEMQEMADRLLKKFDIPARKKTGLTDQQAARFLAKKNKKRIQL